LIEKTFGQSESKRKLLLFEGKKKKEKTNIEI